MSQQQLGEAFGVTFQQVQKYEKGTNRMGASRLQEAARILDVPVPYFFEGADGESYRPDGSTPSHAYINEFTASSEGLRLVKAFTRIARPAVHQHILSESIADHRAG